MSVQHVALEVREQDTDAEVAFWALLGFREVDPPPALRQRSRWVQKDSTQIHLLFADSPVVPAEGHVAVVCDDYEAALARLPGADRRAEHWGSPRAFTRTPSGHRVELMEFPP
jgi:catechol 2,3-dioxygenase-like lactoylglutathione lyase family enzyme